jgi:hypothetical protein
MKAKHKNLLTLVGLVGGGVVVGLAGLLLAVLPQSSKAHDLAGQVAAAQTQLASLHGTPSHAPALRAADLFQLARAMPDNSDMPGLVLDLATAATRATVTLTSIAPSASVVQTDGSTAIPMRVTVDGKWDGVGRFVRNLRQNVRASGQKLTVTGRLFVVDNVSVVSGTSKAEVEATLTVNAFMYGVPLPPVTTDTTGATTGTTTTATPPGSAQAAGATGGAGS